MRAEIEVTGPSKGKISLDGHDVSRGVRGFTFYGSIGEMPVLVLDLAVYDTTRLGADVSVHVAPGVAELLERIGWTPPTVAAEPHAWQEHNAYGNTCHHPGCRMTEEEHAR